MIAHGRFQANFNEDKLFLFQLKNELALQEKITILCQCWGTTVFFDALYFARLIIRTLARIIIKPNI